MVMNPEIDRAGELEAENARLRRAVEELSVLNDLASAIGGLSDSAEIMRQIVSRSMRTIKAEQGLVTLVDEAAALEPNQTLVRSISSSANQEAISPDEILVGWMHLNKHPLLVNNPTEDPRLKGAKWDSRVRSVLAVPLLVKNRLVGILSLYNKKSEDGFTQDDKRLLSILASQSAHVLESVRMHEDEAELERLHGELNLARDIQTKQLPDQFPDIAGYDIAGVSRPAQSVGGDFYDVVETDTGTVSFWVGDVSGKGLPASLTMGNAQAALRSHATSGRVIDECVAETNKLLCRYTPRATFVTLAMFNLDPASGILRYVNAGHVKPVIIRASGQIEELLDSHLVLGYQSTVPYPGSESTLGVGDLLVVQSDGLCEAMNSRRVLLGDAAVYAAAAVSRKEAAAIVLENMLDTVDRHSVGAGQHDDITALVVKRTAPSSEAWHTSR